MAASSKSGVVPSKPLEPRLVGTWHLISYELRDGENTTLYPLGQEPQGQIIYDKPGNMSCHLLHPSPPERPTNAKDGIAYEARISYERYSSYYGPYKVDPATRTVHHYVVGALMPGWAGTTVIRHYVFEGDDHMTLSARAGAGDQQAILKWQRAK